jgi:hypothetical protein
VLGSHELGLLVVQPEQLLLEGRQAEKPVALLDPFGPGPMLRAQPVGRELLLGLELLAADAVQARVRVLVDMAVVVNPLDELLDETVMSLIGGANEEVGTRADPGGKRTPILLDEPIDERLRVDTGLFGRPHVLRSVLVRPGQKERLVSALLPMPDEDVRRDRRVRVPDVRARVHVVDRRCQVVARHFRQ